MTHLVNHTVFKDESILIGQRDYGLVSSDSIWYIGLVESSWNLMAHGDARKEKWRGNWRMEWVASTLTRPRNVVYPPLLTLMRTPRLPVVDWTDAPANLNGLVRFPERLSLVSARVPSRFKRSLQHSTVPCSQTVLGFVWLTFLMPTGYLIHQQV